MYEIDIELFSFIRAVLSFPLTTTMSGVEKINSTEHSTVPFLCE